MLIELFWPAVTTIAVIFVFAIIPGVMLIGVSLIFGVIVAAPIAIIGSLINLIPKHHSETTAEAKEAWTAE